MSDLDVQEQMVEVLMLTPTQDGWGAPAMFWGPPGIGKSQRLRKIASRYGMPLKVLSPGLMGEGAFGVTPVPTGVGSAMRIHHPAAEWADVFEDEDGNPRSGIVLVDELTTAPPALQPPLLGLVQEKMVGDHYLGAQVRVFGAGNPPAQAAAGWDVPLPLANRMGHYDWEMPSAQKWGDYMLTRAVPSVLSKALGEKAQAEQTRSLPELERRVAAGWQRAYAKAAGLVTAFVTRRDSMLHKVPADGDPNGSRGWPSHRSNDLATCVLATATILGVDELIVDELYAGFVGRAAATEFVAFRTMADLPDPEAVLDGAVKWEHDKTRLDRSMAVLSACAAYVQSTTEQKKREKRGVALWTLIGTVMADATDVAIPAARLLVGAKLGHLKEATPILTKLHPVMNAAGIHIT